MSHQPERKEKDCLNCGAQVQGRYCQRCGQENIVSQQSFWSLVKHFVYDIFHFDGKFFDTLKTLFSRPGQVPAHYIQGKRNRYLDPIRMYLFTSALFFLILFSTQKIDVSSSDQSSRYMTKGERFQVAADWFDQFELSDSNVYKKLDLLLDTTKTIRLDRVRGDVKKDSVYSVTIGETIYNMQPIADSNVILDNEEGEIKQNWVNNRLETKWKEYKKQYGDDVNLMLNDIIDRFLHWFPYILFVSLPFFALLLKWLYTRHKQFFYSDHAIFTLYHYIFSFLLILVILGFQALQEASGWRLFDYIQGLLIFFWFIYLLLSLKRFYNGSWGKTLIKFFALNILAFILMNIIFIIFTLFFIYQL